MSGTLTFGPPSKGWPSFTTSGVYGQLTPEPERPRIYIAGPIRGTEDYEERFSSVKSILSLRGWKVVSPLDIIAGTGQIPGIDADDRDGFAADIAALMTCDAIFLMVGWKSSRGAFAEWHMARAVEMRVYYEIEGFPMANELNELNSSSFSKQEPNWWAERDEINHIFAKMIEAPTGDGSKKRQAGEKPSWKVDPSHEAAMFSHLNKWKHGEKVDADSGAHPLVHLAWRALAIAWQESQ